MASGSSAKRKNSPSAKPLPASELSELKSPPPAPLKPRPVLLAVLSLVFAAWISFLVVLYFKTGLPRRSTAAGADASGSLAP
jgi:hypothetical protein